MFTFHKPRVFKKRERKKEKNPNGNDVIVYICMRSQQ